VSDLTVNQAKQPWYLVGYPDDHIGAVSLTDCSFAGTTTAPVAQDIDGLTLSGVTVNGAPFPG
jgi:hypothetical protein